MMKTETKLNIYVNLFFSILIGVVLTVAGGLLTTGAIDWNIFPPQVAAGIIVGFIVSTVIPVGKIGGATAGKLAKPNTFLFNLIMYAVLLGIMLVFMCPLLTVFTGSILMGAPVAAVLPGSYALFPPFFVIGLTFLMILGGFVMKLALKCAGMSGPAEAGAPQERSQEKV